MTILNDDLSFLMDVVVHRIRNSGGDDTVIQAAQVSVTGENEANLTDERKEGLIKYLLREKHGSPFEHNSITLYVKAPIFVFREFHRHRVGFSYNEMSGRYTELLPEFYIPAPDRPLRNIGSSAKPEFAPGTNFQTRLVRRLLELGYRGSWKIYKTLLRFGIANEVARLVLPVGIMSQMYVTTNARAIMNFLSLRTKDERATHISRPQQEIEMVARKIEAEFAELFPITYKYYNEFGRVAP